MSPNDAFNAFTAHAPLEIPAKSPRPGPLSGVTLAVKDIFDVEGMRTGCGLPARLAEARPADRTASPIESLASAGAVIVGKTQCDELCFSLLGNNAFYPRPINPRAPERFSGGSSSGSVAAVAGGLVDVAIGSDTGGSVRAPASFCGLIGMRTTQDLIPMDHAMPLAPSLDTLGWFARNAELYASVGAILLPPYEKPLTRLHRASELDDVLTGAGEREAYAKMAAQVEARLGPARPAAFKSLDTDARYECFRAMQAHEAYAQQGAWVEAHAGGVSPAVRDRFLFGKSVSVSDYAEHGRARAAFTREIEALLGDDGLLMLATVPGPAPFANADADTQQAFREQAHRLLCISGLSGLPQITIPLGAVDGAPFGISLIGPRASDRALIAIAAALVAEAGGA